MSYTPIRGLQELVSEVTVTLNLLIVSRSPATLQLAGNLSVKGQFLS